MSPARIVFVSGLSGSGKTTAMAALEDAGFYGVDKLPAPLVEQFLNLCAKADPPIEKIAFHPAIEIPNSDHCTSSQRIIGVAMISARMAALDPLAARALHRVSPSHQPYSTPA